LSKKIAAVVFINDLARSQQSNHAHLNTHYGLTPAESRVASLLADGHAPRTIAAMIGVSDNTVRSQIKTIFSKTGVCRQAELVRLLLSYAEPRLQA